MAFPDEAEITVQSGDGGSGCISFRRERTIPRGGPDGGDGGRGGSIIARAANRVYTLTEFNRRKHFKAQNGRPGKGKNQTGKDGEDIIIEVPRGTLIRDQETGELLADLVHEDQEVLLVKGGEGGKGNQHFATSTNRAPRSAQSGRPGLQKRIHLSLKILADVGLLGLPNTGKSTLLSSLTHARPRIGDYPFTTRGPQLGILFFDDAHFITIADIPGLIEGAGRGRGLGLRFLKHVERTRLLLHLIDVTHIPETGLLGDFLLIQRELKSYNRSLAQKRQIVLINKMDLHGRGHRDIDRLTKSLEEMGVASLPISALTGQGIDSLKEKLAEKFYGSFPIP